MDAALSAKMAARNSSSRSSPSEERCSSSESQEDAQAHLASQREQVEAVGEESAAVAGLDGADSEKASVPDEFDEEADETGESVGQTEGPDEQSYGPDWVSDGSSQDDARPGSQPSGARRNGPEFERVEEELILFLRGLYPDSRLPRGAAEKITRRLNRFYREANWRGRGGQLLRRNFHAWRNKHSLMVSANTKARNDNRLSGRNDPIPFPRPTQMPDFLAHWRPGGGVTRPVQQPQQTEQQQSGESEDDLEAADEEMADSPESESHQEPAAPYDDEEDLYGLTPPRANTPVESTEAEPSVSSESESATPAISNQQMPTVPAAPLTAAQQPAPASAHQPADTNTVTQAQMAGLSPQEIDVAYQLIHMSHSNGPCPPGCPYDDAS